MDYGFDQDKVPVPDEEKKLDGGSLLGRKNFDPPAASFPDDARVPRIPPQGRIPPGSIPRGARFDPIGPNPIHWEPK